MLALQTPALSALPHIKHGFFARHGGVSTGLFDSLNCGIGSSDIRQNVLENRARVAGHLGAEPGRLLTCHQLHSATAVLVEVPWAPDAQPKADALVTRTTGLALGVLAADCAPVLFADPVARVIAAAHAGWKGALSGILESTLATMELAGAHRARVVAAIGPCISQAAYEVGPEFEAAFSAVNQGYSRYFTVPTPSARAHFDLPGFIADRLKAAGIGHVDRLNQCTYSQPGRFFSYRRTTHAREADYGRQLSTVILL